MILSLFRRKGADDNRRVVGEVYSSIVAAARQPRLYAQWGVPDTPLGRYESLGLHMILFLHRTRDAGEGVKALAQDVVDEFFLELDHSIRELGVGDQGVPKRMKKLGRMFYGRLEPYWKALDDRDSAGLSAALARNIDPENASADFAALAAYMLEAAPLLASQGDEALLAGQLSFPDAGTVGAPA